MGIPQYGQGLSRAIVHTATPLYPEYRFKPQEVFLQAQGIFLPTGEHSSGVFAGNLWEHLHQRHLWDMV